MELDCSNLWLKFSRLVSNFVHCCRWMYLTKHLRCLIIRLFHQNRTLPRFLRLTWLPQSRNHLIILTSLIHLTCVYTCICVHVNFTTWIWFWNWQYMIVSVRTTIYIECDRVGQIVSSTLLSRLVYFNSNFNLSPA